MEFSTRAQCENARPDGEVVGSGDFGWRGEFVLMYAQEPRAGKVVVDQGIVNQGQAVFRPGLAFGTIGDDDGVLGGGALTDDVADQGGNTAVGKLNLIGRRLCLPGRRR